MIERRPLCHVACARADDHAELRLPVGLLRALRQHDGVIRPGDRGGRLHEDDRLLRRASSRLQCVIAVVEADPDDLADRYQAGTETRTARHLGKTRGIEPAQFGQPRRRQNSRCEVIHLAGQVTDDPVPIQQSRLLLSGTAIAQQLHVNSSLITARRAAAELAGRQSRQRRRAPWLAQDRCAQRFCIKLGESGGRARSPTGRLTAGPMKPPGVGEVSNAASGGYGLTRRETNNHSKTPYTRSPGGFNNSLIQWVNEMPHAGDEPWGSVRAVWSICRRPSHCHVPFPVLIAC